MMLKKGQKRLAILALLAALLMLSLAGCGGEADEDMPPQVQDPAAFLGGYEPYQDNAIGSSGAKEVKFLLNSDCTAVCTQYVNALLQDEAFELLSLNENSGDYWYFIGYTGKAEVAMLSPADKSYPAFHVLVEVLHAESTPTLQLRVVHAVGLEFADLGARADLSGVETLAPPEAKQDTPPAVTPQPDPTPSEPATQPSTTPQASGNTQTTKPATTPTTTPTTTPKQHAAAVSASSTYLPDLKLFLDRTPSKDEKYDGGWRQSFREIPDEHLDTVVAEIVSLLEKDRYQLELSDSEEKTVSATKYYHYYFTYTGSGSVERLTDDDGNSFNVDLFVTHYTKQDYFHINFHYSSEFKVEDPGTRVSVDVSGGSASGSGSGSGGTVDGYDPYTPDASKLPCLTCDGDGDCNSCGGSGTR